MNSQPSQSNNAASDMMLYIFAGVLLLLGVAWAYRSNAEWINTIIIDINRAHLFFMSFLPGKLGSEPAYLYNKLGQVDPASFTLNQVTALTRYVGSFMRWLVIPILGCFTLWGWLSKIAVSDHYRRVFTIKTLLNQNVKEFPCMAPIANRKKNILDEPMDQGPWRTARQPLQWAEENGLLIDAKGKRISKSNLIDKNGLPNIYSKILKKNNNAQILLDEAKAEKLFVSQLGPKFTGLKSLPDYQKGLAAAFIAFGCGDKESAHDLLDQMSLSFVEPIKADDKIKIDISGADEIIQKYITDESLDFWTSSHKAYVYPYLMGLLDSFARKKGVLATSQFIWLRPVNRTLWYALNQMGGRESWIEASGPWAHFHTERIAETAMHEPEIQNAVIGLKESLIQKGWLATKTARRTDV